MFLAGRILLVLGGLQLFPLAVALREPVADVRAFAVSAFGLLALGALLCFWGRQHKWYINVREGAAFMMLVWFSMTISGMLPYLLMGELGFVDALFESVSGFTTTGATSLAGEVPPSLLLWHAMMQWIGGLSILVLLATVLPQVSGCFGISMLMRQHSSESRRLQHIWQEARRVLKVYVGFTLLVLVLFWLCGLDAFGSLNLALVTLSTGGGFDRSILQGSWLLQLAVIVCMVLVSGNFLLYWCMGRSAGRMRDLGHDSEFKTYLLMVAGFGLLLAWHLWHMGVYDGADSLRMGFFHVLSFSSTTGLTAAAVDTWPDFDRYVLFLLVFVGGCIGSPTGGIRMMRLMILFRSAAMGMRRTLHPHMVTSIQVNGIPVPPKILGRILHFFFLYMAVFFVFSLLIALTGLEPLEAMGMSASCLSSVGSATMFGGDMTAFASLRTSTKLLCSFLMILGRLEIFSFLLIMQSGFRDLHRKW